MPIPNLILNGFRTQDRLNAHIRHNRYPFYADAIPGDRLYGI